MTYAEALARLLALRGGEHAGMRPGLERILALLEALGHPEERYVLVQVGGTNGKGSVAAMIAAMLRAAGRRTGLYTSPHLVSFRERIRVDGQPIAEDAVADAVDAVGTSVARLDASMFEATTAIALDHFAREQVEVAVLEVGLGGRLDSTTVGRPAATVLARIDLDHQAVLGPTLADIAAEKAAIIRSGVAISARQEPEVAAIVHDRAVGAGIPLQVEGRDLHVRVRARGLEGQRIECAGPGFRLDDAPLALLGTYQPGNAVLAAAAAHVLGVSEEAMRAGLGRVAWPGRFQVLGTGPWLVLDGAHNPGGTRALADSLAAFFPRERPSLIVGISGDKDAAAMLRILAPLAGRLVLTAAASPRALAPAALAARAPAGITVETAASVADALDTVSAEGWPRLTCVAGSLYAVGDALRHLAGDNPCSVEKAAASMRLPLQRGRPDTR